MILEQITNLEFYVSAPHLPHFKIELYFLLQKSNLQLLKLSTKMTFKF